MEPCRAVDAHNVRLGAQNKALEGLQTSGRRFPSYEEQDPDPHLSGKPDPDP
jgi:hypothetical protein